MENSIDLLYLPSPAHVVKLVDTLSSGGSASRRGGSNPLMRTTKVLCFTGDFVISDPLKASFHKEME